MITGKLSISSSFYCFVFSFFAWKIFQRTKHANTSRNRLHGQANQGAFGPTPNIPASTSSACLCHKLTGLVSHNRFGTCYQNHSKSPIHCSLQCLALPRRLSLFFAPCFLLTFHDLCFLINSPISTFFFNPPLLLPHPNIDSIIYKYSIGLLFFSFNSIFHVFYSIPPVTASINSSTQSSIHCPFSPVLLPPAYLIPNFSSLPLSTHLSFTVTSLHVLISPCQSATAPLLTAHSSILYFTLPAKSLSNRCRTHSAALPSVWVCV